MAGDAKADKRALLLRQLREGKAPLAAAPLLAPEPGAPVPLTRGQEQMWLDCQLAPDEPVYNEAVMIRRTGRCDVQALRRAFNLVLSRHEAWRTNFASEDGQPYQIIRSHVDHPLPLVDLSSLPEPEREARAMTIAVEHARPPFDLENDLLVRPQLVRVSDADHRLYLTLHHLIFDGVALRLLLSETVQAYGALAAERVVELPDLPAPYAHYACWERQNLKADELEPRLAFWRDRLRGATPVELLPDRPPPSDRTRNGAMARTFVDRATLDRLREVARHEGATFFLVLLTAYAAVLHRYSGQEDLVIAALVDGRRHRALENLMGFMINPLPVRVDVSGDPSFAELLGRVRDSFLTGLANEVPFGELLRALSPDRDSSRNPIFQAMFSLDPPLPPLGDGWELDEIDVEFTAAKCDLQLLQDEREAGAVGRFVYSTDLFEADTWMRLAERWRVLLEGIAVDPSCRISALPFLTGAERTTLVDEWNRTEAPYPPECVHELFEGQARAQPDSVAVLHGDRHVTYGELDALADRLADRLRDLGVGRNTLVGLCAERGPDMVAAVLGIMKAGGAYVPLDPEYPGERLTFMIGDAGIRIIVSQTHLLSRLPATGAATICVDDVGLAPGLAGNGSAPAGPDDLAYVIYTSGSTGAPKGVMIEHRGVVNHITALIRDYGLGPADTVVQLPSLSFHPSVRDVLGTLCAGARLVVLNEADAKDPLKIVEVIAREEVTCALSFVPSLLRAVLESPRTDELLDAKLRLILTCGEGLREQDAHRARERFDCVVANQFGPTETIMACSKHTTGPGDPPGAMVPAGKAEANARLYVVDRHGGLAPIGAPGELHVGGPSLARGYLNRPELTAERFGADPFCASPGARIHRTGDLVRYRGDGCLESLGRVDDQVKIRGHRVELGEVEAALARCGGVREAAAAVLTDAEGECRLLGVLVPDRGGVAPEIDDVRSQLERTLPAYMVPAAIAMVDELPLTPSGKVDRFALARMDADGSPRVTGRARRAEGDELPADGLEVALAEIWADALGRDRIGRHDNFFDLGGHSLMAARVIATIERRLGKRVPLAAFFGDGVTVAGLAAAIAEPRVASSRDADGRLLVPVRAGGLPALFCVYPNDSSLLAARHLVPVLERDHAVFGLRPPLDGWSDGGNGEDEGGNPLPADPPHGHGRSDRPSSVEELARPLLREMLRVQPEGPYLITGYSFGGIVAYELAGRLTELGHRVAFLGLVDIMTPRLWARDVKPRLRHLVTSRRRRTTAVRLVTVRRRQARVALAHVGLREPVPPKPDGFAYLERMRLLGGRYRTDGLDCPLVVFLTEASLAVTGSPTLGWETVHHGPIEAVEVPGDHLTLWKEPNVARLAAEVAARVRSAAR